jgi:ABC-type protease/lipase transport system fused ATPase/permease subunit
VIKQEMSGGAIRAAFVTMSRALAPIGVAIANWKIVVAAHGAVLSLEARARPIRKGLPRR